MNKNNSMEINPITLVYQYDLVDILFFFFDVLLDCVTIDLRTSKNLSLFVFLLLLQNNIVIKFPFNLFISSFFCSFVWFLLFLSIHFVHFIHRHKHHNLSSSNRSLLEIDCSRTKRMNERTKKKHTNVVSVCCYTHATIQNAITS